SQECLLYSQFRRNVLIRAVHLVHLTFSLSLSLLLSHTHTHTHTHSVLLYTQEILSLSHTHSFWMLCNIPIGHEIPKRHTHTKNTHTHTHTHTHATTTHTAT